MTLRRWIPKIIDCHGFAHTLRASGTASVYL
jgi:hypothetical protein